MNRRQFLQSAAAGAVGMAVPLPETPFERLTTGGVRSGMTGIGTAEALELYFQRHADRLVLETLRGFCEFWENPSCNPVVGT